MALLLPPLLLLIRRLLLLLPAVVHILYFGIDNGMLPCSFIMVIGTAFGKSVVSFLCRFICFDIDKFSLDVILIVLCHCIMIIFGP